MGKWTFEISRYADSSDMPNMIGLFVNGSCWIGLIIRPRKATRYHGEFAIIIANTFVGWWYEDELGL